MPPLNERELTEKIKQYKPLAYKLAQKYKSALHTKENFEDLLQEADIAIFSALQDYDPEREKNSSEMTYIYNRIKWHLHRVFLKTNHSGVRPPYGMGSKEKEGNVAYSNAMAAAKDIEELDSFSTIAAEDEFFQDEVYHKVMDYINSKEEIIKRLLLAYLKLSDETVASIQREMFKQKSKSLCYAIIKAEIEELKDIINDNK